MNHEGILKELPRLPVIRKEYCSQKITDDAIDYLFEHHPDLLLRIVEDENPNRVGTHYEAYQKAIYTLQKSEDVIIPDHDIALIDIAYELSRRIRIAYGMNEIEVQGRPLAPSIEGPYPELIKKPIGRYTKKDGFTQKKVDSILEDFYQANHKLCYVHSEQFRRDQNLFVGFSTHLRKNLPDKNAQAVKSVARELAARLIEACDLPKIDN